MLGKTFSQGSEKNIKLLKTEVDMCESAASHLTHIYLLSTTLHIQIICTINIYICCAWVIMQVFPGGLHLYYQVPNINGQYCSVLTNYVNIKDGTW